MAIKCDEGKLRDGGRVCSYVLIFTDSSYGTEREVTCYDDYYEEYQYFNQFFHFGALRVLNLNENNKDNPY